MKCWFWNIDISSQGSFSQELQQHRLRQGWGYDDRLNLRTLHAKVSANIPLDPEEQKAWDRCHAMLLSIQEGDLVVIKNVPAHDTFTIAKVTGQYDFQIDASIGHHGHFLPIEIVAVYHKSSQVLPGPFVYALNREQYPLLITHRHHQTICKLASINTAAEEREQQPSDPGFIDIESQDLNDEEIDRAIREDRLRIGVVPTDSEVTLAR